MSAVKQGMDEWGRAKLLERYPNANIPEGADIVFDEDIPSPYYCETCGPDPYTTRVSYFGFDGESYTYRYYGTLGELIQQML